VPWIMRDMPGNYFISSRK